MSRRSNAPYKDRLEDDGRAIVYEGHDAPRSASLRDPKTIDQPGYRPSGRPMQNGLFFEAAQRHSKKGSPPELVRVYEKLYEGVWVYNGLFELADAWTEASGSRSVFKFRLRLTDAEIEGVPTPTIDLDHNRVIPSDVKLAVWKRDGGRCTRRGSRDNLHFDHIIPYSLGGSSLVAESIQILCARHNLEKHARIE